MSFTANRYLVEPGGIVRGSIEVPGDKSISHRSIMLGALAEGMTEVSGFLEGEDALATLNAFQAMGVTIDGPEQGTVRIHGVGLHGLKAPRAALNLGNSGTSMRLMAGILSGQTFASELCGDESLSTRPMGRICKPLALMGAKLAMAEKGTPPIKITGCAGALKGITYESPMASAQVKSCLLLAGLYAQGTTKVIEPGVTRDHTERMLRGFGYEVHQAPGAVWLSGGGRLSSTSIRVPGDLSSAAFFIVAATLVPGSELTLKNVGMNPTRNGVIEILRRMGADIEVRELSEQSNEPVVDLTVRHAQLRGIEIPADLVPLAIDEFPVLFVAAACADGVTRLQGAEELRVKESDRIQVMADNLQCLGIDAKATEDGMIVTGGVLNGGRVHSHADHRIAMSMAVAGLMANGPVEIDDCANVATSFPNFLTLAQSVGMKVRGAEVAE